MSFQRALVSLLVGALALPVALCILYALARLLEAMQDQVGGQILGRTALVLFALWIIDLVALVILLAVQSLGNPPRSPDER